MPTRSAMALLLLALGCSGPAHPPPPSTGGGDLAGLHDRCPEAGCAAGQRCLEWCGIAGCRPGLVFHTCEIPCERDAQCPAGLACLTIADGPGRVCTSGDAPSPRSAPARE
jgi:hypothetical protein